MLPVSKKDTGIFFLLTQKQRHRAKSSVPLLKGIKRKKEKGKKRNNQNSKVDCSDFVAG